MTRRPLAATVPAAILVAATMLAASCGSASPAATRAAAVPVASVPVTTAAPPVRAAVTSKAAASAGACQATHPPGARYTLVARGRITGTLTIKKNANNRFPSIIPKIAARFCGSLDVATESGTVPAADISFAPAKLYLGYHVSKKGKPTYVQVYDLRFFPDGPATAQVVRTTAPNGAAPDGGLELTLTSHVTTELIVPGTSIRCFDGPVALNLSTEAPGGAALTGPLQAARTVVAEQGFTIPAVPNEKSCEDGGSPFNPEINGLLLLPATDTMTSETLSLSVRS